MKAIIISCLSFLLFPLFVTAQVIISGTVTEAGSNKPVPYATIYINGTTNGTITNTSGEFRLEKVQVPCEIVISHVSYSPKVIYLKQTADSTFHIQLKPRDVELGMVEVSDKNRREENLARFKERFLGEDYWGKNAQILNDSVLVFNHDTVPRTESSLRKMITDANVLRFTVKTKAPLWVHQPLLGYKVRVDLIYYEEFQGNKKWKYELHSLGYFYFQPDKNASRLKTNRYRKKRLQAYYNSGRHFGKSLFNNQLNQNGYLVLTRTFNPDTKSVEYVKFDLNKHTIHSNREIKIVGLKNKTSYIEYYERFNRPVPVFKRDLVQRPMSPSRSFSSIHFLKDTCTIRVDGSRPDNSIMFGPEIGDKRVGAMLPYDFSPEKR